MKVILAGNEEERARLRADIDGGLTIVGEFDTLAAARAARIRAGGILVASRDGYERPAESLTPRELDVLELLAEGLPNKMIAARLGVSDQTVKFHVAALSGKLGAVNRTDAVRRGVRQGLITL